MIHLDSSVAIAFLRGDRQTSANLARYNRWFLSGISLGELIVGAKRARNSRESMEVINKLVRAVTLLFPDYNTSFVYGDVVSNLQRIGKPIPHNDLWIAALSLQHGLPLGTGDTHFSHVPGLQVVSFTS